MITREKEIKVLLKKEEYEKIKEILINKYKDFKTYIQVNYYYDTAHYDLIKAGHTLRIRQKEDGLTLEYKSGKRIIDGVRVCDEYSEDMSELPMRIPFPEIKEIPCEYIGNLITERTDFKIKEDFTRAKNQREESLDFSEVSTKVKGNFIISLDKNFYLGETDYEIEIEFEGESESLGLENLLTELGIRNREVFLGKYSRFIHKLNQFKI